MSHFKEKLTEQKAAAQSVQNIMKEVQAEWPRIYKSFKDKFKEKFIVEDETRAAFDLALAVIAQDLLAIKNLFMKDQAERIEKWVYKCIDTEDWGKYAIEEVKKYEEIFHKEIINAGGDPMIAIPAHLVLRWIGKNINNFDLEMNGKKTGILNPVLLRMVMDTLTAFPRTWKRIKDNFDLIEGDLPLDFNLSGLRDYVPERDKKRPGGTIQYYDEHGNLKEMWLSSEQLNKSLKESGAKRIYKVLIKGHWNGVKEDFWELSEDNVENFVDETGYAYAICYYEKGEPKYKLIKKKIWEHLNEVEEIMNNPNLSFDQKQERIKKLLDA